VSPRVLEVFADADSCALLLDWVERLDGGGIRILERIAVPPRESILAKLFSN